MKKLTSLVLAFAMALTSVTLAACGGENPPENITATTSETAETAPETAMTAPETTTTAPETTMTAPETVITPAPVTLTTPVTIEPVELVNEEAEDIYNILINNADITSGEDIRGIVLLDLDFDGTPELIVSKVWAYEYEWLNEYNGEMVEATEYLIDADVYRVRDNALVYIDTLYNMYTLIYSEGNVLGLKTLENGEKAWFNVSYKNRVTGELIPADYLFTLEGDELIFTEVFSGDPVRISIIRGGRYYIFGELMVFEEITWEEHTGMPYDPEEPYATETVLIWGDYSSFAGEWEIYIKFKQDWCKDMQKTTASLFSPWLSEINLRGGRKNDLSEIQFDNFIAEIVNSFFKNGNMFLETYYYEFVGVYAKPVIYLYPEEVTDVDVRVYFPNGGRFTCTYPDYGGGWSVTAYPDGTLINKADGREYSYLYWEGEGSENWDFSSGFVVKGSDTVTFLQEKLEYLGLIPREYNEFIVYWLPLMQNNAYNLITFQTERYEENATLYVSPKPDSVLRVFMVYTPLEQPVNIPEQELEAFERTGFAVIEWGGALFNSSPVF